MMRSNDFCDYCKHKDAHDSEWAKFCKHCCECYGDEITMNFEGVEVEPAIHCKDCKHRDDNGICDYHYAYVSGGWFCWAGDRKMDGAE